MIHVIPYEELGHHDYGWLDAHYHFSFGDYHDPSRMGFGALRVINDDTVQPGKGFAPHSHRDMEIITYVRRGAITHRDNQGHKGRTGAGDVQVMSAGKGIQHSEYNLEGEPANLYQIWIAPREKGIAPRWDQRHFPKEPVHDGLPLLVSGRAEHQSAVEAGNALYIHADAAIYGGRIKAGTKIEQTLHSLAYLLVSKGSIELNKRLMRKGDGAQVSGQDHITLRAREDSEVLLIEVAAYH